MREPYPSSVRSKACRLYLQGLSSYQVADEIGCTRPTVCNWLREAGIETRGKMPEPLLERFWNKVQVTDGCWEWQEGLSTGGYGKFWVGNETVPAHRFAWEVSQGPIPDGLFVCHHCDNRKCVRPDHLWLGTSYDNMVDCVEKGRVGDTWRTLNLVGGKAYDGPSN